MREEIKQSTKEIRNFFYYIACLFSMIFGGLLLLFYFHMVFGILHKKSPTDTIREVYAQGPSADGDDVSNRRILEIIAPALKSPASRTTGGHHGGIGGMGGGGHGKQAGSGFGGMGGGGNIRRGNRHAGSIGQRNNSGHGEGIFVLPLENHIVPVPLPWGNIGMPSKSYFAGFGKRIIKYKMRWLSLFTSSFTSSCLIWMNLKKITRIFLFLSPTKFLFFGLLLIVLDADGASLYLFASHIMSLGSCC